MGHPGWGVASVFAGVVGAGQGSRDPIRDAIEVVVGGQLLAGPRIHQKAGVTNLTAQAWLQRWREFRLRHPA